MLCAGAGLLLGAPASANGLPDRDNDGVPDRDEIGVYSTDPDDPDTDKDGFSDYEELLSGFSPHNPEPVRLEDNDQDKDGLNDRLELRFGTNLLRADTDGDGHSDGDEVRNGFDPKDPGERAVLPKRIEISTASQELSYFLGGVRLGVFTASTGKRATPTPKGRFAVDGKSPRAWSRSYGLWMPYWLSLGSGRFGIHELPEWPNGAKEGAAHLGQPVSHGCIRLGVGPARFLFDWTPLGTPVFIH